VPTTASADGRPRRQALVFVGFMGAGKSSAARRVAAQLRVTPLDSDSELERELGQSIASFIDRHGEQVFRDREEEMIVRLLARPEARVVALGGGGLRSERVREALRAHTVVHLDVRPAEAWHRVAGKGRPLARDRARFEQLYREREAIYESVADAVLPSGDRDVVRRALPAMLALADAPAGTRLVWAHAASGDYPVFLARGLLAQGFFHPGDERTFVVVDENVARRQRLADPPHTPEGWRLAVPGGELQKTLAAVERVVRALAAASVGRDDLVVAVGGGVIGDMVGFSAAVYQRGVRYVQVPTTLVAQVDAAYGGKTGVDLPEAKNYVGAYHQPTAVLVDPAALDTLPREELAAGYAEVVKTALIAGGPLWARVREGADTTADTILRSIRTKLAVVADDERDAGRRQVLNLGHTVGHAIEVATGYRRYRHGEAVGIGLLCALRLSGREDLRAEVAALLSASGLPLCFEGASADEVVALVQRDKKRRRGRVPFVLVEAPGKVTPGHAVSDGELLAAVSEACAP